MSKSLICYNFGMPYRIHFKLKLDIHHNEDEMWFRYGCIMISHNFLIIRRKNFFRRIMGCERDNFWLLYPIHFKFDMCININEGKKRFENGRTMMMPWAHYDDTKSWIAHNFWTNEPIYFILNMDVNLYEGKTIAKYSCIMINHERIMIDEIFDRS